MSTKTNQFDLTTASIDNGAKDGTTPSNTGAITVTPKVWAKMQSLLALLPTKLIMNSPNAANQPIVENVEPLFHPPTSRLSEDHAADSDPNLIANQPIKQPHAGNLIN
ncbi:hypothetical protein PCANC_05142 [Puccinia coronata f. sp. avenae]|uniref:Uncharacterized protein n=1 Tax=Puccinia coronata f. sp. avenae TaxID=200324 RepID=A0A2N5W354_9BASI|nr:hypothetical protein PCANC_05142 [Puccinia coronata f. sp. avenae]